MKVSFYATLRQHTGGKTVELPVAAGGTLRELLELAFVRFPAIRAELMDEHGELLPHVHVFVNGRDAHYLPDMLETVLAEADTVDFFPAVAGG